MLNQNPRKNRKRTFFVENLFARIAAKTRAHHWLKSVHGTDIPVKLENLNIAISVIIGLYCTFTPRKLL